MPALAESAASFATPIRMAADPRLQAATEKLLRTARFAVVHAGDSREPGSVLQTSGNLRPWKSYRPVAEDIAATLERLGASPVAVLPEDMNLPFRLRDAGVDFVWLNTGGVQGAASAGHAAATMEMLGMPYVGHDPLMAASLDDKAVFKRHMAALGVPTAPFCTWRPEDGPFLPRQFEDFERAFAGWDGGFVVKPVNGRASLNVVYVENRDQLVQAVLDAYETCRNTVLIEGFLPGREYCAAVCGPSVRMDDQLWQNGEPFVFACVERLLDADEKIFTSMDTRPITEERMRPLERTKDRHVLFELERLARRIYSAMPLETLVRLDVRADHNGRLYVLEANPKPDLKAPQNGVTSIVATGLAGSGLGYDDLIYSLLADRLAQLLSRDRMPSRLVSA